MILTHLNKSSKLVSFLLLVLLTACGTNPINVPSSRATHPPNRPIETSTKALGTTSSLNVSRLTTNFGSLLIQSDAGFQCPNSELRFPMDNLVLASDRTTYSPTEIEQMRAYVGSPGGNRTAYGFLTGGKEPPSTLRWVLGGSMDPVSGMWPASEGAYPCGAILQLTNTGNTPIQIPSTGVQLTENTQPNTYQYRLIDACSIIPKSDPTYCIPAVGNRDACNTYTASIQLGIGMKDTVFSTKPLPPEGPSGINDQGTPLPSCGVLTVAPNAQVILKFIFSLAPNMPLNVIYSLTPEITEISADGTQTLLLSQWASTLTFASADRFSCYGLQGTTFVLEQSPMFANNQWCM